MLAAVAGGCLLYPQIEIAIVLDLLAKTSNDTRTEAIQVGVDSHLLYAIFLAHTLLLGLAPDMVISPEGVAEAIRQRPDARQKLIRLRLALGAADLTLADVPETYREAFKDFLAGVIAAASGGPKVT